MTAYRLLRLILKPGRRSPSEHEDAFPPNRPNARYVIGKETVGWARGSGRDAMMRSFGHSVVGQPEFR